MASRHLQRRPRSTNLKHLLAKTFEDMSSWFNDVREGEVLRDLVDRPELKDWLVILVRNSEEAAGYVFDSEGSVDWSYPGGATTDWEFVYRTWLYPSKISFGMELRRGKAQIKSWKVDRLSINFSADKTNVDIFFRYSMVLEIRTGPHATITQDHENPDPFLVREIRLYHWSTKPIYFPLKIVACWMKGELEDWDEGVVAAGSDNQGIRYDSTNYPKAICDLFQRLDERAFDDFFRHRCISKEDYRFIVYRLKRKGYFHFENHVEVSDQRRTSAGLEATPPANNQDRIEALELSTKVIEKLRIIGTIHNVLSYSKWAKPLGYSDKGPCHDFLKKMKIMGLIVITKAPGGIGVGITLTQKAKRLIAASF